MYIATQVCTCYDRTIDSPRLGHHKMKGLQQYVDIVRCMLFGGLCMELWNDQQKTLNILYSIHSSTQTPVPVDTGPPRYVRHA